MSEEKVEALTKPPTKKTIVATAWPVDKFTAGDTQVTADGVELSAEQAKKVYEAAELAGVKLVSKEVSK